jgi:hypothetical protein
LAFGHAGEELDRDVERTYRWPLRTATVDDSLDNGDGTITHAVRAWSNSRDGPGLSNRQDAVTKDRKKLEESRGTLWSFMMYEIDPMLLTATQGMEEFGIIKNDTDTLSLYRLLKMMCELHSKPNSVELRREYDNSKLPKSTNVSSYLTTLDDIVTRLNHTLAVDQQVPERDKVVHLKAAIPYEVFSKIIPDLYNGDPDAAGYPTYTECKQNIMLFGTNNGNLQGLINATFYEEDRQKRINNNHERRQEQQPGAHAAYVQQGRGNFSGRKRGAPRGHGIKPGRGRGYLGKNLRPIVPLSEKLCYNCGDLGHISPDCTQRKAGKCKFCLTPGHLAKYCRENPDAPNAWPRVRGLPSEGGNAQVFMVETNVLDESGNANNEGNEYDNVQQQGNYLSMNPRVMMSGASGSSNDEDTENNQVVSTSSNPVTVVIGGVQVTMSFEQLLKLYNGNNPPAQQNKSSRVMEIQEGTVSPKSYKEVTTPRENNVPGGKEDTNERETDKSSKKSSVSVNKEQPKVTLESVGKGSVRKNPSLVRKEGGLNKRVKMVFTRKPVMNPKVRIKLQHHSLQNQ